MHPTNPIFYNFKNASYDLLKYKQAVTTCTHAVTSYIAQELEYQRKYAAQYESFEFENRRIFANVLAPHKEAILFEKVL